MRTRTLDRRTLNRTTLERQLLLQRSAMTPRSAVAHLVGLQAQIPLDPYLALWSRLEDFDPEELGRLLTEREVVRGVVIRGTLHLVTGDDALLLRPLEQPVLDKELAAHRDHRAHLAGLDLTPVLEFAAPLLAKRPSTGAELRAALAERFPDLDAAALAYACRNHLALVQVPPRGVWGRTGTIRNTTAQAWLGRPLVEDPSLDEVVLRYLTAFGPALPADAGTWSRLTGMREAFDRLLPRLRTFRDEAGRVLYDLPDAPIADPDRPAPPRFLPEYDNVLLSHSDRSRFTADDARRALWPPDGRIVGLHGTVLHDGFVLGPWRLERDETAGRATLRVAHLGRLPKGAARDLEAEGLRMVRFQAADATEVEVRLERADP